MYSCATWFQRLALGNDAHSNRACPIYCYAEQAAPFHHNSVSYNISVFDNI